MRRIDNLSLALSEREKHLEKIDKVEHPNMYARIVAEINDIQKVLKIEMADNKGIDN